MTTQNELAPLDVDVLYDQLNRELAFAEEGTNWHAWLTKTLDTTWEWLDASDDFRLS
jgi:hypothetical protein